MAPLPLKLRRVAGADEFIELSMKPGSWERNGIPEHGCWMRKSSFEEIIASGGQYDADDIIRGLMDWLDVTDDPLPAIATLRKMLDRHYPADDRTSATCHFADENGVDRRFMVGPIDLEAELVTWQRDSFIFALGQPSTDEPGRIVIGAPYPLPLDAALKVLGLAMVSFMEAPFDSFAGAIRLAGSTGNFYALDRGELTTHHWPHGLGRRERERQIFDCSDELYPLPTPDEWLAPRQVAMLVGVASGYLRF